MELLAIIGPPPGLTNEPEDKFLESPMKITINDCWDQSTACSSSPRQSSPTRSVESSFDLCEPCFFERTSEENQTTLIIQNIVGHCTRKMLLDFLDRHGLQGKYNLLYLPQRFAGEGCFHYAFVNFVTNRMAIDFQDRFNGCDDAVLFGDLAAEISWSQCQGLEANIEKFRNSSVMHSSVKEECRPLLFKDGRVVPFPKPTRRVKRDRRNRREVDDCDAA